MRSRICSISFSILAFSASKRMTSFEAAEDFSSHQKTEHYRRWDSSASLDAFTTSRSQSKSNFVCFWLKKCWFCLYFSLI